MLKLEDIRKKSAEIKAAVTARKATMKNPVVEQLRSDTLAETNYTPAARERVSTIPIDVGIPANATARSLPTKMNNLGALMDERAGGTYNSQTGRISLNPDFPNWESRFNKNMIRHEAAHSMDANVQSSEQWDSAINGLGMIDSNKTPVKMLMNKRGLADSMGMSKMRTKKGREAFIKQLSEAAGLYTPDEYTQDVEGFADVGGRVTDLNALEGSDFVKLYKSLYAKRK